MVVRKRTAEPDGSGLRFGRQRQREILRNQMLDAAAAMIVADGAEALSMRKLAHGLGCAPMTLYSYFSGKHELLMALAQRRFDALAVRLAGKPGGSPLDALRELYLDYGRFGLENPNEYRIMFMTAESQSSLAGKDPNQILAENRAFAAGFRRVEVCVEAGLLAGDAHAIATLLWTAVHGAVAAILTFPAFPFGDPARYIARAIDLTTTALRGDTTTSLV